MLSGELFSRWPIHKTKLLNGTEITFRCAHWFQITVTCVKERIVGRDKKKRRENFFFQNFGDFAKSRFTLALFRNFWANRRDRRFCQASFYLLSLLPNSSISLFFFFVIFGKSQKWHLLLHTFLPPLTLELIFLVIFAISPIFWKNRKNRSFC